MNNCEETGGIIVGNYSTDLHIAVVTEISGPPCDSIFKVNHFIRGTNNLYKWLKKLWQKKNKEFYIGEWHSHPSGVAHPSNSDIEQMNFIASSKDYHCSQPLLIIIGGKITSQPEIEVFVFSKDELYSQLELLDERQLKFPPGDD